MLRGVRRGDERIASLSRAGVRGSSKRHDLRQKPLPRLAALGCLFFASDLSAEQTGPARRVLAGDDSTQRLAIVAPDGKLEWEIKVGAIHDAHFLPNGNILLQQGWTKIVEVTPEKKTVWEYEVPLFGRERKGGHGPEAFGNSLFNRFRAGLDAFEHDSF